MKINTKKTISAYILAILILSSFSYSVSAITNTRTAKAASDGEYTLLEPLPCIPGSGVTCPSSMKTTIDFRNYMQYAFNLLIGLAAAAAVFMMVWGGFKYMSTDSWSDKSEGLDIFKHAIYGLLLVLSSYLILKTIDPRLVEIPSNIVPTITLKKSLEAPMDDFFVQMINEASKYQEQGQGLVEKAKKSKADVSVLESQKQDIIKQINDLKNPDEITPLEQGLNESDPKIQELRAKIENIDNEINRIKAEISIDVGLSTMTNGVVSQTLNDLALNKIRQDSVFREFYTGNKNINKSTIDAIFAESNIAVEKIVAQRTRQLEELGSQDKIGLIQEKAREVYLTLDIAKVNAIIQNTKSQNDVNGAFGNFVSRSDTETAYVGSEKMGTKQELRNKLQTDINNISTKINSVNNQDSKADLQKKLNDTKNLLIEKFGH